MPEYFETTLKVLGGLVAAGSLATMAWAVASFLIGMKAGLASVTESFNGFSEDIKSDLKRAVASMERAEEGNQRILSDHEARISVSESEIANIKSAPAKRRRRAA